MVLRLLQPKCHCWQASTKIAALKEENDSLKLQIVQMQQPQLPPQPASDIQCMSHGARSSAEARGFNDSDELASECSDSIGDDSRRSSCVSALDISRSSLMECSSVGGDSSVISSLDCSVAEPAAAHDSSSHCAEECRHSYRDLNSVAVVVSVPLVPVAAPCLASESVASSCLAAGGRSTASSAVDGESVVEMDVAQPGAAATQHNTGLSDGDAGLSDGDAGLSDGE
jgi:hypothetical protein